MTLAGLPTYYYVDSQINSGGTAVVYRGIDRHCRPERAVAIKKLFANRAQDDFVVDSFREEANHYLHLSHPNIVKLIDYIEERQKGTFYLIMEYVDGTPLDVFLTKMFPIREEILLSIFCQILDAVDYLHTYKDPDTDGILHLDIKPSNIMVLKGHQIKILDMGISAKLNDKRHNPKKCGTPAFMSPEQINQEALGCYTDIFALGVTLFNLLTGKLPFSGENHTGVFDKICNTPTPVITDFYPDANPAFQPLIERALHKNSNERYQTCKEFKDDLLKISSLHAMKDMKKITVGRDSSNMIVIDDSFVGRTHLEILFDDSGNAELIDLYTKNGTFVNGQKVVSGEAIHLTPRDIVKIGNTLLPWQGWKNRGDTITNPGSKPRQKRESLWKKIKWRSIFTVITSVVSLLLMILMLLRYLK